MTDGGWLKAPAGLLRADQSPKPAYDELLKLVKGEWWLKPTTLMTDANGQVTITGFAGEYAVTVDGVTASVTVGGGGENVTVGV
jgi:hypothetical protein